MSRLLDALVRMDRKASRAFPVAGVLSLPQPKKPGRPRRAVWPVVVLAMIAILGMAMVLRSPGPQSPANRGQVPAAVLASSPRGVAGEDPFRVQLRHGREAAERGAFQESAEHFERALELNLVSVEAWNNLGVVLTRQGDLAGGVRAFQRAVELRPKYADAHRNLAVALERQGDPVEATRHYRAFLSLGENSHPDRAEIRRHLAVVRERSERWSGTASRWLAIPNRARGRYAREISLAAARYKVDPKLVRSVIRVESGFNPRAVSRKGARGLMQLMPRTALALGVRDAFSPRQNIDGGVRYLRRLIDRYRGNLPLALAAYNAGPRAVDGYGGIPPYPETREYVRRILALYAK